MFKDFLNLRTSATTNRTQTAVNKLLKKIETLVNKETPGSEGHIEAVAMKANAMYYRDHNQKRCMQASIESYEAMQLVMEPYKTHASCIYLYVSNACAMAIEYSNKEHKDATNAIKYAKIAEDVCEKYFSNHQIATNWLIGYLNDQSGFGPAINERQMKNQIGYTYYHVYKNLEVDGNDESKLKYVVPAIRFCIFNLNITNPANEAMFADAMETTLELGEMLICLCSAYRFRQLNHALAYCMYYLVMFRRNLPESKRSQMNEGQGILSGIYALWGTDIIFSSIHKLKGEDWRRPNNEEFEEAWDITHEPGIKPYLNQFPIEPIETKEQINFYMNRAISWKKRCDEMCPGFSLTSMSIKLRLMIMKPAIRMVNNL